MITRRSLLTSTAIIPLIPHILKKVKADEMPWSTHFDGTGGASYTEIKTAGPLPNMPATTDTGFISGNILIPATNQQWASFTIGPDIVVSSGCHNYSQAIQFVVNSTVISLWIWGTLPPSCIGQKLTIYQARFSLASGAKCHVAVAWNSSTAKILMNGINIPLAKSNSNGTPEPTICNKNVSISGHNDMTDMGIFMGGDYINPADVIEAFYDIESGYARRNASNGAFIIANRQPQVWLSGPPNKFVLNEAAGDFGWPSTYNGSINNDFTVNVGSLSLGQSDPFEPGSGE